MARADTLTAVHAGLKALTADVGRFAANPVAAARRGGDTHEAIEFRHYSRGNLDTQQMLLQGGERVPRRYAHTPPKFTFTALPVLGVLPWSWVRAPPSAEAVSSYVSTAAQSPVSVVVAPSGALSDANRALYVRQHARAGHGHGHGVAPRRAGEYYSNLVRLESAPRRLFDS
jgi:hypothetical protein